MNEKEFSEMPEVPFEAELAVRCILAWRRHRAAISVVARDKGYAVGVHGSMKRDLDLIAAPWTEDACSPEELAESIRLAVGGVIVDSEQFPRKKPHGRLAWSIHLGGGPYLDLSILPRL